MSELNDIYAPQLLELAAHITHTERLENPDISADAHSKLCGSTIHIDLNVDSNKVIDFGQSVKACLLGQSAAAVVAKYIVGTDISELRVICEQMKKMLKEDGPPPNGRWSELALLESVRHFKARHASTLLIFSALDKAFDSLNKQNTK